MPPRTRKMGKPRKADVIRMKMSGVASPKRRGRRNSWTDVRIGRDTVPPPVRSWASGPNPKKSPRSAAPAAAGTRAFFFSSVVMNRALMTRKPAAMIITTRRFGKGPTLSAAVKAFRANERALRPKASVSAADSTDVDTAATDFSGSRSDIAVASARCFPSREVMAAAMNVAASTRCWT